MILSRRDEKFMARTRTGPSPEIFCTEYFKHCDFHKPQEDHFVKCYYFKKSLLPICFVKHTRAVR